MVPRSSAISSRVMPMPESITDRVLASSSTSRWMASSASASSTSRLVSISNWTRFSASEALEISSRIKISRSVYNEWTRMLSSCWISALNSNASVDCVAFSSAIVPILLSMISTLIISKTARAIKCRLLQGRRA
jgi:hypothetical protein